MSKKSILLFIILFSFISVYLASASCGVSPGQTRIYLHPGETSEFGISLTMQDSNGDGTYNSSVGFSRFHHEELEWASLSPNNFITSMLVTSTTENGNVMVYINNNTLPLPIGSNYFEVTHVCECDTSGGIGGCLASISMVDLNIIYYEITGLGVNFSSGNISNIKLTWNQFTETSLEKLVVLRMENQQITTSNYQSAEIIAELPSNETQYEIENTNPSKNYYYVVYGYKLGYLVAISKNVKNDNAPTPFFLISPLDKTINSTSYNFSWENPINPCPIGNLTYTLYLANNSEFVNPIIINNILSNNYLYTGLINGQYFWKVKAKDSCGFETYASDAKNLALQSNGGVAFSEFYYEPRIPEWAIDGNYNTVWMSGGGIYLWINLSSPQEINRIKVGYRSSIVGDPYYDLMLYGDNDTLLKNISGNLKGQTILKDLTVEPYLISTIKTFFSLNCQVIQISEIELYKQVGSFIVNYAPALPLCNPGDANGDGKVDGGDLALWQQNYDPLGKNINTWEMGNWNTDNNVDGGDLALWQQNYDPLGSGNCTTTILSLQLNEVLPETTLIPISSNEPSNNQIILTQPTESIILTNEQNTDTIILTPTNDPITLTQPTDTIILTSPKKKSCIDNSDEFKAGYAKITKNGISLKKKTDYCQNSKKLVEYSCDGTTIKQTKITCKKGCKNNACIN